MCLQTHGKLDLSYVANVLKRNNILSIFHNLRQLMSKAANFSIVFKTKLGTNEHLLLG